jgi:hypothetical protein
VRWALVIGGKGEGRGDATEAVAARLRARGVRVGGFLPRPAGPAGEGREPDLVLEDLATGARVPLAFADAVTPELCSYRFDPAAFAAAAAWVGAAGLEVALLGGLGAFEAQRRGHWPLVERMVASAAGPVPVLVVRRESLAAIALALPADPSAALELPAAAAALDAFAVALGALVAGTSRPAD